MRGLEGVAHAALLRNYIRAYWADRQFQSTTTACLVSDFSNTETMAYRIPRKPLSPSYDNLVAGRTVEPSAQPLVTNNESIRQSSIPIQFGKNGTQPNLQVISLDSAEHQSLLHHSSSLSSTTPRAATGRPSVTGISHKIPTSNESTLTISKNPVPVSYVSWGIDWKKPFSICAALFCAASLSIGHHFYYQSLNNTVTGDEEKRAWPVRFGTAFAFLVVSCLHASTAIAFGQYFWMVVKRKSFTIS
jgi:hypothetical protein